MGDNDLAHFFVNIFMKALKYPIAITTLLLIVYNIMPFVGVPFAIIFFTMLLLTGLTIWMVIKILKDGKPSGRTFEDHWYDDQ